MRTSNTSQLQKARNQVGSVVDQFGLDKRALEVADKAGVVKRKRRLGFSFGRRRPDWGRIATYGVAAVAGAVGSKALRRNGDASGDVEAAAERGAERGAEKGATQRGADTA